MSKDAVFSARRALSAALLVVVASVTVSVGTSQAAEASNSTPAIAITLTNGWG